MIHLKDINIVIPGVKPRRFLHLSDPHIAYYYPGDDPEYVKYAKYYSSAWGTEDKSSNENFEDFLSLAVSEKPDAVTIAGDLQDACSVSNVKYLVEKLSDFPVEYLYVYGNHEPEAHDPAWLDDDLKKRAETARLVGKHPEFFVKDYGDLLIIGIAIANVVAFITAGASCVTFLILFDILGLIALLVPFFLLRRLHSEPLSLFDTFLALAAIFSVVSCMAILAYQAKTYGTSFKATMDRPAVVETMEC